MKHGHFRCIVCLLLVCILVVGISPIRARAVVDPLTLGLLDATIGVPILLAWLGITKDAAHPEAFDKVNSDLTQHLTDSSFIIDGMISVGKLKSGDPEFFTAFLPDAIMKDCINWLYDSGIPDQAAVLKAPPKFPEGVNGKEIFAFPIKEGIKYGSIGVHKKSGGIAYWACDKFNFYIGSYGWEHVNGPNLHAYTGSSWEYRQMFCTKDYNHTEFLLSDIDKISANVPVVTGNVARPLEEPEVITPEIAKPKIIEFPHTNPNLPPESDPEKHKTHHWYPYNPEWVPGGTQEEAQKSDPVKDPDYKPDPGPDPDPGPNPNPDPNPDPNPNPDPGGGSDPGGGQTPNPNDPPPFNKMAIDLSKFFPFCIPFDLYDFFSCLSADPLTPAFSWEMALPTGGSYTWDIDLKAFDPVAAICRKLFALLFAVGLAVKTRDLIKG